MARRKSKPDDDILGSPVLALPPPAPVRGKHHEHERDPYDAPAGAVPGRISNLQTDAGPVPRKGTKADAIQREFHKSEQKAITRRYNRWLDSAIKHGLDRVAAVAEVMGVSHEEAETNYTELHAEIMRGRGHSEITTILEEHDLGVRERVHMMRSHVYSDNAAASLKALQLVGEMDGSKEGVGDFERDLRLWKEQQRMQGAKR